ASDECAASADRLLDRIEDAERARGKAVEVVRAELERAEGDRRGSLRKILRHVSKGTLPTRLSLEGAESDALHAFEAARRDLDEARADFAREYDAGAERVSASVREIASTERFREAVIWQNRRAYHTGVAPLLRSNGGARARDSKTRQHEELVANYIH